MGTNRKAQVTWNGDLLSGSGTITSVTSGTLAPVSVSWPARTESADAKTSPEELLAAAHASCYCMALSAGLGKAGTPPKRLDASAEVTFDKVGEGWGVVASVINVVGEVDGISDADFVSAAEAAKNGCPISKAIQGNVVVSVQAKLK